ncbi:MAG: heparinase II/III family protein [Rhizobiaceae bacterium]|nr:heparinase II/III family protein [Rhizobiaceae bacterium]
MRVPDSLLIPALISSELWRRFARRVRSGPLYRWRFATTTPSGLTMAPQSLHPADPQRAIEFYSGHYNFGEESLSTGGETPFAATAPSDDWFASLHGFRWLRHHQAIDTDLARANANALMTDWVEMWGHQLSTPAWRSDIVASRMISWFCHAPLLIKDASPSNYRLMLRSLARQSRYLHHNVPHARDGYPRLLSTIALAYASICLAGREKTVRSAARELDRELQRQILPDGGHISRNPVVLVHLLADMLPLRQAYEKHGQAPSKTLNTSIDRMMGALRFFRHSNGDLAQFNGTGFSPTALMANVLRYDTTSGAPQNSAPQSGFERISAGKSVVLMDTGKPTNRTAAPKTLAGTLSFELSSGATRFIANCGVPDISFERYAPFARATAAHSTVTIDDTSSSRFATDSAFNRLLPTQLIRSPGQITVSRGEKTSEKDAFIDATHDGYRQKYGLVHRRRISLRDDGRQLSGCDSFEGTGGKTSNGLVAALRFHLPATNTVSMLTSGHSILIAAPNKDAWVFTCLEGTVVLEESIQFSGPGQPRKSEQIVVYIHPARQQQIRWSLEQRTKGATTQTRKKKAKETGPAPDLLDVLTNNEAEGS